MKKMRFFMLGLLSSVLILTSCSGTNDNSTSSTGNSDDDLIYDVLSSWTPKVTITYDNELAHHFDDMTPLDPINQEKMSSTLFDVPRNSTLNLHFQESAPEYLSCQNVVNNHSYYLSIKDVVTSKFQSNPPLTTDGNMVSLHFDQNFQYGRVYKISLDPNSYLQFENKDPSIQTLVIEMEDDPNEESEYDICVPKENIPTLDLSYVSDEIADEENKVLSFVYSSTVPDLKQGDVFLVKAGSNDDKLGMADFYGIFESKEQVEGKWKIYYSEPSGDDIYDDFRQKGFKPIDLSNVKITATKEYIQDQLRYSNTARGLLSFFRKQADLNDDIEDLKNLIDHLEFGFTFNYYDNTLLFTFTIGAKKIKLTDNLFLSITYKEEVTKTYNIDYDVSLKKEWGVPVGIAYKVKCIEDIIESHTLLVSVQYEKETPEQDEDEVKNSLIDELKNAKLTKDNFFKKIKESADACKTTEGNKTTIPIFKLPFEIGGGTVLEIRLDLSFDLTLQAMAFVSKQMKSQDVVFNFSSEDGGDTSDAKKIEGSNNWEIYFMGLVEFKIALKLALAWYIPGTYKYFHVEAFGEVWIKIGLQGSLMASFATDTDGDAFSGNMSIDFYVMFGVDVGIDIVLILFHIDATATLFKAYILRIYMCNELEHYADNTVTHIDMTNKTKDDVDNYDILIFRVWDGIYMQMDTLRYQANDRQSIITLFGQEILGVQMFTFTSENESLLKINQDGEITIPDGTPAEFTTHFTIHVHNAISFVQDREIEVYFNAPDAHHIYYQENIDGTDTGVVTDGGRYRPTVEVTLPEPPDRAGYKFLSYELNGETHQPGDKFEMPENDVTIKIKWHKIVYYQVMFIDGKGNIIFADNHVEEFTAAREPDPAIRDQFMEGYEFIGWDKNFSSVNSNLIVRGIYVKVGD